MIDIKKLTKKDIGKWVMFSRCGGKKKLGKIKYHNDKFIFVVYKCEGEWSRFKEYTAAATNPEDLVFCETLGEPTKDEVLYKGRDYDSSVKEANNEQ